MAFTVVWKRNMATCGKIFDSEQNLLCSYFELQMTFPPQNSKKTLFPNSLSFDRPSEEPAGLTCHQAPAGVLFSSLFVVVEFWSPFTLTTFHFFSLHLCSGWFRAAAFLGSYNPNLDFRWGDRRRLQSLISPQKCCQDQILSLFLRNMSRLSFFIFPPTYILQWP